MLAWCPAPGAQGRTSALRAGVGQGEKMLSGAKKLSGSEKHALLPGVPDTTADSNREDARMTMQSSMAICLADRQGPADREGVFRKLSWKASYEALAGSRQSLATLGAGLKGQEVSLAGRLGDRGCADQAGRADWSGPERIPPGKKESCCQLGATIEKGPRGVNNH